MEKETGKKHETWRKKRPAKMHKEWNFYTL